jgi:hypothetical protein
MNDRIYIVSNYWQWKPLAVLSLLIRIVCYGYNHVAFEKDGLIYEMVGSGFFWSIRKLLGKPVSYQPNEGSGYKVTPLAEWLRHSDRRVVEMRPTFPLILPEVNEGYGFLDLLQILLHIIRRKWLLIGHDWNGVDGCRFWHGYFCSEFVGLALQHPKYFNLTPLDIRLLPELEFVQEFETKEFTLITK